MAKATTPISLEPEELHALKLAIQEFYVPNTVLILGLGTSASFGLPTMGQLADYLAKDLEDLPPGKERDEWEKVRTNLDAGKGLEESLRNVELPNELYERITDATGKLIREAEDHAAQGLLHGAGISPLGRLIMHFLVGPTKLDIVTSNYDCLVELQAEQAAYGVDSGYPGGYGSSFDPKASERAHRSAHWQGKAFQPKLHSHLRIHKPHGSLDWIQCPEGIRRSHVRSGKLAIIPPGPMKYRDGYKEHFAQQLERARKALRDAQRFIALGYGFNDDQLEQAWCPGLKCQKPILIATMDFTENARKVLASSPQAIGLSKNRSGSPEQTLVASFGQPDRITKEELWSVAGLVQGTI